MDQVASKYCSAEHTDAATKNAYKRYVETIAPGAFSAYKQCKAMSAQNIQFNVDPNSILPIEFTLSVSFVSRNIDMRSASLRFSHSADVKCRWQGTDKADLNLLSGASEMLKCQRKDQSKVSYVTVVNTTGTESPLTLPWRAFNPDGVPVLVVKALEDRLSRLTTRIDSLMAASRWPHAINCGNAWDALFVLHGNPTGNDGEGFYAQVYPHEYRHVRFKADGSFAGRAGHNGSSVGCEQKSISQLRAEKRTYEFLQK